MPAVRACMEHRGVACPAPLMSVLKLSQFLQDRAATPQTLPVIEVLRSTHQSNSGIDTIILYSTQTEYDLNYKRRLDSIAQLCNKTVSTYYIYMALFYTWLCSGSVYWFCYYYY